MKNLTSLGTTNYLKGIAIISVLINHYLNRYIEGNQSGIANGIIAIFYILSGFGIFYSYERRFNEKKYNFRIITKFYSDRILRIYPFYIIVLLIDDFLLGESYSIWNYLGVVSPYLFVNLILQCYLVSFIVYYLLKKLELVKFLLVIILTFILINVFGYMVEFYADISFNFFGIIIYRGLYLGHIFLFCIGMSIPFIIVKTEKSNFMIKWRAQLLIVFSCLFLIFLYITRIFLNNVFDIINAFIFSLSTILMIYLFLYRDFKKPLLKSFYILGTYSYPIYLFHLLYYTTLESLGIIQNNSIVSIFLTIILLPILSGFCILIQNLLELILNKGKTKLFTLQLNSLKEYKSVKSKNTDISIK